MTTSTLRSGIALLICLGAACASVVAADGSAIAQRLEVIQTRASVVVGLRDFDLIKRRHPDLKATVTFLDGQGMELDSFRINYAHEATGSHVVFRKAPGKDYARVSLKLVGPRGVVLEKSLPLPAPVAGAGRAKRLDEVADLAPGTAFDKATAPSIRLPDYGSVQTAAIPAGERTVNLDECRKRVTADFNFPTTFARCPITNQTEFPDDNSRKSIYLAANNDLYDPDTGQYESALKYLIEIPIEAEWVEKPGDLAVTASVEKIRLHMTTDEIKVRRIGVQRITGNRKGSLTQLTDACLVGADGNIYFAVQYRSPIRFNISKAAFEAPPINIYDFYARRLPRIEDLPYKKGSITGVRPDFCNSIFSRKRRIWVVIQRNAIFGTGLGLTSVISLPIDHWDDKEAFEKAMRVNAESWPESKFPLWDTHVQPNDRRRRLRLMVPLGDRFYMQSYHNNYAWVMEVAEDDSTRKLTPIRTLGGKKIVGFELSPRILLRDGKLIGLKVEVTLEGEEKPRPAFLALGAETLTETVPKNVQSDYGNSFKMRGWLHTYGTYGACMFNKYNINYFRGRPHVAGVLTIHYDALERMRRHPGAFKEVLARIRAASMGPEYYVFPTPGDTMEVLGVADYPMYNFARYDCSTGAETVRRTSLTRDMGDVKTRLSLPAKMGPYGYRWFREGADDVLYYAGYTGIGRLVYRREGKVPERHSVSNLAGMKHVCLDGAPDAFIKWFRDIVPGLDDKIYLTGVNKASRGGTAYAGGLMYFHRNKPNALYKISRMSRGYDTTSIAVRLKGEPGVGLTQDIFLSGGFNSKAVETLPKDLRPTNTLRRIFVYADRGDGSHTQDLFGFTAESAGNTAGGVQETAVSVNGLYLLILMGDGTLTTLDLDAWRFVDAVRVPGGLAVFRLRHNDQRLLRIPDGGLMICAYEAKKSEAEGQEAPPPGAATFLKVKVDAGGGISLTSHMRCTFARARHLGTTIAFLYDSEKHDGSYDLVLGPHWREPEGAVRIIRDFLPPRR